MPLKKLWFLLALALAGCSSTRLTTTSPSHSMQDLLQALPADNRLTASLVFEAMLDHGANGLQTLVRLLDSGKPDEKTTAHYALDGLARFCGTLPNTDPRRQTFVAALSNSLASSRPTVDQAFLINRLNFCPSVDGISSLRMFLHDDVLCEPAAMVLQSIAEPAAGEALLEALAQNSDKNKKTLIQALGQIKYSKAGPALLKHAHAENKTLKEAALFALAEMGWNQAESVLQQNALQDDKFAIAWLTYADATTETQRAIEIARTIVNNREKTWPDHTRTAALTLLVKKAGSAAFADLQKTAANESASLRAAALRLAEPLTSDAATQTWLGMLPGLTPKAQADVLGLLGRQKAVSATTAMRRYLSSEEAGVRAAALQALISTLGEDSVRDLLSLLKTNTDETMRQQIKQNLLTLPHQALSRQWDRFYPTLDATGKNLLLDVAVARQDTLRLAELIEAMQSADPDLRQKGVNGLRVLGKADALPACLSQLTAASATQEIKAIQDCIIDIINREKNQKPCLQKLEEYFQVANKEEKIKLLRVWRGIGSDAALKQVIAGSRDPALKDEALRTLCDWPSLNGLEPLVQLAESKEQQTYRILAVRAALRILRENPMGDLRQLDFLQRLMKCSERNEEKTMVLSQVGQIKSISALKYAAGFCADENIGYEAALATVQTTVPLKGAAAALSPEQAVAGVVQAQASKPLQQKIAETPLLACTENQPPEGFTALFNGKDLCGWKGLVEDPVKRVRMNPDELNRAQIKADEEMRQHWQAIDGVLYFDGKGQSLCTSRDYTDFEMMVDWKIEKWGDSGIYLRGAPQVQIWDTAQWPEGSGGLYNNQKNPSKPLVKADKPVGEWNTFHIIMRDQRVTVYLNEVLVVDHVIMENYWERDKPIYRSGQIELQAHNTPLYFRNIFIKELPTLAPTFDGPLFNGKDLQGWQIINGQPESWQVADGVLYTTGQGGGWLSTTREFADFKLSLEFRVPADGNSGVFLRSPHHGDPAYTGMEIQVLDDYAEQYARLKPWQYTGSVYGIQAPSQRVSKRAGEWQKMVITCRGPRVCVELNGRKTIDTDLVDHMQQSKEHPGIQRRAGYIGLQNHSSKLEYRNIWLEELR